MEDYRNDIYLVPKEEHMGPPTDVLTIKPISIPIMFKEKAKLKEEFPVEESKEERPQIPIEYLLPNKPILKLKYIGHLNVEHKHSKRIYLTPPYEEMITPPDAPDELKAYITGPVTKKFNKVRLVAERQETRKRFDFTPPYEEIIIPPDEQRACIIGRTGPVTKRFNKVPLVAERQFDITYNRNYQQYIIRCLSLKIPSRFHIPEGKKVILQKGTAVILGGNYGFVVKQLLSHTDLFPLANTDTYISDFLPDLWTTKLIQEDPVARDRVPRLTIALRCFNPKIIYKEENLYRDICENEVFTMGRGKQNSQVLPFEDVSRAHVKIYYDPYVGWILEEAKGEAENYPFSGTFVLVRMGDECYKEGRHLISGPRILREYAHLVIGPYIYKCHINKENSTRSNSRVG